MKRLVTIHLAHTHDAAQRGVNNTRGKTMQRQTLFVVKTNLSKDHADYGRLRYEEGQKEGAHRIVTSPFLGDEVLDVLTIDQHEGKLYATSARCRREGGKLILGVPASYGDQYEQGAEAELLNAVLSTCFYPRENSPHYAVATAEVPFRLRWAIGEGEQDTVEAEFLPAAAATV